MFAKALTGLGMAFALLGGTAWGQSETVSPPAPVIYPTNVWAKGVAPLETEAELDALIDDAMSRALTDEMGETRALVVIHKGRLVAESYQDGFTPDTKLVSWSMAKSITQALVGRAVMDGLITDIDAPIPSLWEARDPRAAVTWRQWMTMTDGLDYTEVGETDLAKNDVVQMMFGPGRFDMVSYVEGLEQIHEAGTHWNYSTAGFHTIARAVQDQVDGPMPDWLQAKLFTPLGMDAQPEFDASGTFLGGSLVYASARDFARFGYLYLRDGVWAGERLLPEGWPEIHFARRREQ